MNFSQPYHNIRSLYISRGLKHICPIPLKCNTYHGCQYNCTYCNCHILTKTRTPRNITPLPLSYLKRTFKRALNGQGKGEIHQVIRERWPLQIGVLSDPFQPLELVKQNTLNLLQFLQFINYPFQLLTKSDIILQEDYMKILQETDCQVMISIPSLDPHFSNNLEGKCPPPDRRLEVLEQLIGDGIPCTLRIWPLIPSVNEDTTELIGEAARIGVKEVQAAYLHLYNNKKYIQNLSSDLGFDLIDHIKDQGMELFRVGKYFYPPEDHKVGVLERIKGECQKDDITFNTPNHPPMNDWKPCCGPPPGGQYNQAALKCSGYQLGDGVTPEEYLPEGYVFEKDFKRQFNQGKFSKIFNDIKYDGVYRWI